MQQQQKQQQQQKRLSGIWRIVQGTGNRLVTCAVPKVRPTCACARTDVSYALRNFWCMFIKYGRDEQMKFLEENHFDITLLHWNNRSLSCSRCEFRNRPHLWRHTNQNRERQTHRRTCCKHKYVRGPSFILYTASPNKLISFTNVSN